MGPVVQRPGRPFDMGKIGGSSPPGTTRPVSSGMLDSERNARFGRATRPATGPAWNAGERIALRVRLPPLPLPPWTMKAIACVFRFTANPRPTRGVYHGEVRSVPAYRPRSGWCSWCNGSTRECESRGAGFNSRRIPSVTNRDVLLGEQRASKTRAQGSNPCIPADRGSFGLLPLECDGIARDPPKVAFHSQ